MEYWIFIYNMDASATFYDTYSINIVLENFLSISLMRKAATTNNEIEIYCFPLEEYYRTNPYSDAAGVKSYVTNGYPYIKETKSKINGQWIFVRCAYSVALRKFYLNQLGEQGLEIPKYYEYQNGADPVYIGQDYLFNYVHLKENSRTKIRLENFKDYSDSDVAMVGSTTAPQGKNVRYNQIYLRNLNIYREYIPQTVNFPNYL